MYIIDTILFTYNNNTVKKLKPGFLSFGFLHQIDAAKEILKKAYKCKNVEFKYHKA